MPFQPESDWRSDASLAYALMRLTFGVNLFMRGIMRIYMGTGGFALGMLKQFEGTPMPAAIIQPFALTLHLERLKRSAAGLGLPEYDEGLVRKGVDAVLAGGGLALGRLRITYTGGPAPTGRRGAVR